MVTMCLVIKCNDTFFNYFCYKSSKTGNKIKPPIIPNSKRRNVERHICPPGFYCWNRFLLERVISGYRESVIEKNHVIEVR